MYYLTTNKLVIYFPNNCWSENGEIYIIINVNKIISNVEMWWQGKQQNRYEG